MPGHDSKGSVEQDWAALGAELDAKAKGVQQPVLDECWATPEDGWAALGAQLAAAERPSCAISAPTPQQQQPAHETAVPSFEEFCANNAIKAPAIAQPTFEDFKHGGAMSREEFHAAAGGVCYTPPTSNTSASSSHGSSAIPSFEEFKASCAASKQPVQQAADPLLAMRNRDPASIENGWAALGAELYGGGAAEPAMHNSVEDGWAALGAELEARPASTWAEMGRELER